MDGVYRFDRLKSKASEAKRALRKVVLHVARRNEIAEGEVAIARGQAIAEGICVAKDLGNLPGNICTPTYLADDSSIPVGIRAMSLVVLDYLTRHK
jgi:leucyl aminopeptidase